MIKISIIIPIYNSENTIGRCVDSIIKQSFEDYEIILVDDGSKDNSALICDRYELQYPNIKVIHQANGGVSSARNSGLAVAQGDYLVFVDSDDFLEDGFLEKMFAQTENSDITICGYYIYQGATRNKRSLNPIVINLEILKQCFYDYYSVAMINAPWAKIYKRSIIQDNNISFKKEIHWGEDLIFNMDYFSHCKTISFIPDCLYGYVLSAFSATSKRMIDSIEEDIVVSKYIKAFLGESKQYHKYYQNMLIDSYYRYVNNYINGIWSLKIFNKKCGKLNQLLKSEKKIYLGGNRNIYLYLIKIKVYFAMPFYKKIRRIK